MSILGLMHSLRTPAQQILRFPEHSFEYSSRAFRGRQLRSKYHAERKRIIAWKHRDYVRAKYDAVPASTVCTGITLAVTRDPDADGSDDCA